MPTLFKRQILDKSASLTLLVLSALLLALLLRTPLVAALALQAPDHPRALLAANPPCATLNDRGIDFALLGYLPLDEGATMLAWRISNPKPKALDAIGITAFGWTRVKPSNGGVFQGDLGVYDTRWGENLDTNGSAFRFLPRGTWLRAGRQESFFVTVKQFDPHVSMRVWARINDTVFEGNVVPAEHPCAPVAPTPTATPTNTPMPFSPLPTPTSTPEGYTLPAEPVVAACVFTPPAGGIVEEPVLPLSTYAFSAPQVVLTNTAPIGIQQWLPDSETLLVTHESLANQLVSVDLVNTSNSEIIEIVEPRAYLGEPMWLAMNRTVAWQEYGPFQDETFNINQPGFWVRSFDPPSERRLSEDGRSGWSVTHDVSSDGKQVVFLSLPGGTQPLIWNQASKTLRALPVDLAAWRYGKGINYRLQAFSPLWHPDGNKILFWDGAWAFLYDLTTDSGCEINLRALTKRYYSIQDASWSPNGRYLLIKNADSPPYTSTAGPYDRVLVLNTDTGEAIQYALGRPVANFSWAPDNQTVAMQGGIAQRIDGFGANGVYLLNVRSGDFQRILPENETLSGMGNMLAWSPDGKSLAMQCMDAPRDNSGGIFDRVCISQVDRNQ